MIDNKKQDEREAIALESEDKNIMSSSNTNLSIKELISKINFLSESKNPYMVSNEIEEIKSLFYLKLKKEEEISFKEKDTLKKIDKTIGDIKNKQLHPDEQSFKLAYEKYRKVKFEFRKIKEKEEEVNLNIKKKIIEDIDKLTKEEESIKKTFEHFKILQEQWKKTGHVSKRISNDLWQSYHHHIELFYDYIKINNDLRDLDFTRNLEEKTKICQKAEKLLKEKSLNKAHNSLQELHEHWRDIGPVRKELREKIWERFKEASKSLNRNRNNYFIEQKENDKKKFVEKENICKEIDSLSENNINSHKKWKESTEICLKLEIKWKDIGKVNKTLNKTAWTNLRTSLNNFYYKRNKFYKLKKEEKNNISRLKISICQKAESLKDSTDWKETSIKLIALQNDWKKAGFTDTEQSKKIWKHFKQACNTFFNAKKEHYKILDSEKEKSLVNKEELLSKLKKFKTSSDLKNDINKLKEFSNKWKDIGYVARNKIKINDVFYDLINTKFEELGLSKKALENEKYKNRVSAIKGNDKAINNEKISLKLRLNDLKKEITQYENNISFFGKNKNTELLRKQVEKKIEKVHAEIELQKQKLQILNKG